MTHKHHSIPKSRGGTDEDWNLVELDPYAHAYEHALDFVLFDHAPIFDCRHEAWPLLPEDLRKSVRKELSVRMSNRVISEETRTKISLSKLGKEPANKGKKMPEEFGQKISQSKRGRPAHNKGRRMSPGQKESISKTLTGRTMPEEVKTKISEAMKGRNPHNTGKKTSEEVRKKISESMTGKTRGPYKKRAKL
jgi:hypothetical protein